MLNIELLRRLSDALRRAWERSQSRRDLLALDDHMLKDIGISRADAVREGDKPFWRP
ncbi:MAG: DUF1127 domain-containing protein [Oceanospirillaceae bacterium]|nr:DUF1127 domain-containing protein [Oceanospirillaceae bacterium]